MTVEELRSVLHEAPVQLEVVVKRSEEIEQLRDQIRRLETECYKLRESKAEYAALIGENIGLRSRCKQAKRILKAHGLPCDFLDR